MSLKMLNSGSSKLDHILLVRKASRDQRGLGFIGEASKSKTVFVKGTIPNYNMRAVSKAKK